MDEAQFMLSTALLEVLIKLEHSTYTSIKSMFFFFTVLLSVFTFRRQLIGHIRLPSNAKAKHCSTWSWRQVNRPWLRATLHPVKICLNVAGDEHKGQEGSSPTQRFRFCGDGRTSYVDLIRKLILHSTKKVLQRFFRGSLRWSWCYIAPLPFCPVWFFSCSSVVLQWWLTCSMPPLMVLHAPYDKDKSGSPMITSQ